MHMWEKIVSSVIFFQREKTNQFEVPLLGGLREKNKDANKTFRFRSEKVQIFKLLFCDTLKIATFANRWCGGLQHCKGRLFFIYAEPSQKLEHRTKLARAD